MKNIIKFSLIIGLILGFNFYSFANDGFEEFEQALKNDTLDVEIYKPSSTITLTNINNQSWFNNYDLEDYDDYDDGWVSPSKITKPTWIKCGSNYYLVTKSYDTQIIYIDDNDKEVKTGKYSIGENNYVKNTLAIVYYNNKYLVYYFDDDGVCANNGFNVKNGSKDIIMNSDKTVKDGYEIERDITDINLGIFCNDDFDGTKGIFDKETKRGLYDGYWILDKENGKYDLYKANSSGSSSSVSGATNKTATELYTIIRNKGYEQQPAIRKNPNEQITTTTKIEDTTTNNKVEEETQEIKQEEIKIEIKDKKYKEIKELTNDFKLKAENGKLILKFKDPSVKLAKDGYYYNSKTKEYYEVINGELVSSYKRSDKSYTTLDNCFTVTLGNKDFLAYR